MQDEIGRPSRADYSGSTVTVAAENADNPAALGCGKAVVGCVARPAPSDSEVLNATGLTAGCARLQYDYSC